MVAVKIRGAKWLAHNEKSSSVSKWELRGCCNNWAARLGACDDIGTVVVVVGSLTLKHNICNGRWGGVKQIGVTVVEGLDG
jgi:hypothetical protein